MEKEGFYYMVPMENINKLDTYWINYIEKYFLKKCIDEYRKNLN
jgi:hypothetical protein